MPFVSRQPVEQERRRYSVAELVETRRQILRYSRSIPVGPQRNHHRQIELSLRVLFRNAAWLAAHTNQGSTLMQKFLFEMKDGVSMRDRVGIEFKGDAEAIIHCKELAQHFRDDSLRDDKELEISVVNAVGREIHREFVHRTH
jgi:hypothetical protein